MKVSDLPVTNENYQRNKQNGEPAGTPIFVKSGAVNAYQSLPQGKMLRGQSKDATHSVDLVSADMSTRKVSFTGQQD